MTVRQFDSKPAALAASYRLWLVLFVVSVFLNAVLPVYAIADAKPVSDVGESKTPDENVKTKSVGTLHMSEGKVIIKQNQIFVLSDASDPITDAELQGVILDLHQVNDADGSTTNGVAFFTRGFSIQALDDPKIKESVIGNDGLERIGRIEDVTTKMLRIKTPQGVQALPVRYIVKIKSPRAFTFSLPESIATATGSIVGASKAPESASPAAPIRDDFNVLSFNPTYAPDLNRSPALSQVTAMNKQLTRKNTGKKIANTAAAVAGVAACFAIPIGIGLACPPQR